VNRRTWQLSLVGLVLAAAPLGAAPAQAGPSTVAAAAYYVDSVGGNDANAGTTAGSAWRTLGKVNGFAFQPGDTILFKRATSWTGSLHLSRSGTATSPITLGAYGSDSLALPVVGGNVTTCVSVTGSHWLIGDLRARGCNWAGFELFGDGIVMDTIQADANVVGVSIVDGSNGNTIRWSKIINNNKMSVNTPKSVNPDDDSGAFGFLIHGDDNIISRNTVSGHFAASYDYGYDGAAFEIYNGNRNLFEYNITADNETFTELGRNGAGKTADGNVFAYNSVTSTKVRGAFLVTRGAIKDIGAVTNTDSVHNSVYLPAADTQGWVCYDGCAPDILKLRGNVIRVGGKTGYEDGSGADEDRGVYYGNQTQFVLGPNSVAANPLFTSTTNLRLTAGSPAIGRGEDTGFAWDLAGISLVGVTRFDAGAYQY
jgi:hypothetical protein